MTLSTLIKKLQELESEGHGELLVYSDGVRKLDSPKIEDVTVVKNGKIVDITVVFIPTE